MMGGKPKGIGCEAKTLAEAASNMMISIEIKEGKESSQKYGRLT